MKVVLMHGKDTDPSAKWYPWFMNAVEGLGFECIVPELPEADDPKLHAWVEELARTRPDVDTVLVGHSRGGVAILRFLEGLPAGQKVKKVILIATNSGRSKSEISEDPTKHGFFSPGGFDFEKIRTHCDYFIVLHSKDDPWVPFSDGEENAEGLQARFLVFEDRRHFGKGVETIPELLTEVRM